MENVKEEKKTVIYTISYERRRKMVSLIEGFVWLVNAVLIVLSCIFVPRFASWLNFRNILLHSAILGVVTIGEAICLIGGNFDLSVGSTLALAGMIGALLSKMNLHSLIVIIIMISFGLGSGFLNGIMVRTLRLNAFIATLITMLGWRGIATGLTEGKTIWNLPEDLCFLGSGTLLGFPIQILIMLVMFVVFHLVMTCTRFGRHIYIVGDNEKAAYNAGISVDKIVIATFAISGALSSFAGLLMIGRLNAASPTYGSEILFEAMSAAIIGGVSLKGGMGNLLMALGGVVLLSIISNILNLSGVSPYWAMTVRALLLLFAVLLDSVKRRFIMYE